MRCIPNNLNDNKRIFTFFCLVAVLLLSIKPILYGQGAHSPEYGMPPKVIADLVDAPPTPSVSIDPTVERLLILERSNLPSIEELSQPELRIAGLRINPRINGRSRRSYYTAIKVKNIVKGDEVEVTGLPESARIRSVEWSPDGKRIAFLIVEGNGQSLLVAEAKTGSVVKLITSRINSIYGSPFRWHPNGKRLICKLTPENRGEAPEAPMVPVGPIVQETTGRRAPARTYQDLLKNTHDEALLEYYLDTQVVSVTLDGEIRNLGDVGIISRAQPSPDGKYLLVERIHRPYSYLVPVYRFPFTVEIWDMKGNLVKQVADLPLAEEIPIGFGAVRTGPRSFNWRADTPATLYWVEAQDDGNPKIDAEIRDEIFTLKPPFDGKPLSLIALNLRYSGVRWGGDNLALVSERWQKDRSYRTWIIKPKSPGSGKTLLFEYSSEDRYANPGSPSMKRNSKGFSVLLTGDRGKKIYLSGSGASPEGDRPFLDELTLKTKKTNRLWRSKAPYYEYSVRLLDAGRKLITRRESKDEPPNYYLRDLRKNTLEQVTEFPHPTPELAGIQKELIRYERDDGVQLTGTLYLPAGYSSEDGPLPMLMWAYPREFKSADAAGQVIGSPYRFMRVSWSSRLIWLLLGYSILDGPTMPIIGEGDEEPNDTFVEQLVASAAAAVDEVVRRGVAEYGRIGIGGHSYGAFMTANLLAHSDLYSAGIARSGAYNRTLTPFGFQREERTFWEAPEVYFRMSPFMHAEKVNEPILLIHGEADNNSGTFPLQSRRYYNALKGHGAKARLVMLPNESHGYRARESVMHMLSEMNDWLDKYVKNAPVEKQRLEEAENTED